MTDQPNTNAPSVPGAAITQTMGTGELHLQPIQVTDFYPSTQTNHQPESNHDL